MRFLLRWAVNTLTFYLAFYLVDTLLSPCFYLSNSWIAIVLAVPMAFYNSRIRPFPRFKTRRKRSFGFFGLTVLANFLFMQIIALVSSPLQGNPFCIILAAIFVTLLAALMNHLIGFKPKDKSKVPTREQGLTTEGRARQVRQTDLRGGKKTRKKTRRTRARAQSDARTRARTRARDRARNRDES